MNGIDTAAAGICEICQTNTKYKSCTELTQNTFKITVEVLLIRVSSVISSKNIAASILLSFLIIKLTLSQQLRNYNRICDLNLCSLSKSGFQLNLKLGNKLILIEYLRTQFKVNRKNLFERVSQNTWYHNLSTWIYCLQR